jgi:dTDP-4-amino-4,6-dideoxygalactose transaminase
MHIPFLDLQAQYALIKEEIAEAIQRVIDSSIFSSGPLVEKFEAEFAQYCNSRYALGVGSGTAALWLTLLAMGIGQGDEVITVPNSFIATVEAISFCGAKPVFVDVDEKTYTMNPDLLHSAITSNTRAILPVHLFGQMADMDPILKIAKEYGLSVVEDACQAHGAEYKGKRAGSMGDAAAFSFYPGKNLGAYGEAGAVVTNNITLSRKIRMLRNHGQVKKNLHEIIGWNARLDEIQGAILSVKLKHLDFWNESRREKAKLYNQLFENTDSMIIPKEADTAKHIYHIYAIRAPNRDDLIEFLRTKDIYCGIHYPLPAHLQKAYRSLGYHKGDFPIAEKCSLEFVSLPMFAELTADQVQYVAQSAKSCTPVTLQSNI